jgi:hypothetical protein
MPTALISNVFHSTNEKSLLQDNTSELERQLKQGSVEAATQLASVVECKHDDGCYQCSKVADYYLTAFRLTRNKQPIICNALLFHLVEQTVDLIHCHLEVSKIHHLPWVSLLINELRELGKQLKDESSEPDRMVPLPLLMTEDQEKVVDVAINEAYGRAIRITIYYCRATLYEEVDINKSISYYRKCVSVIPTQFDAQMLQQSARTALQHLTADRPKLPSRTSSVSSASSSSCSNCGIEKRGMPVCSKCKSQYYCGVRCLKAHHECR